MKKNLITAFLMTVVMTVLLGLIYPLVVTGIAQLLFHDKANGQILSANGQAIGSRILAQPFTSAKYFHPRPSNAGNGYDAANSGGTNLGPTNQKLIDRVRADATALHDENPSQPVPVDLITTSASGLDRLGTEDRAQAAGASRGIRRADAVEHVAGRAFRRTAPPGSRNHGITLCERAAARRNYDYRSERSRPQGARDPGARPERPLPAYPRRRRRSDGRPNRPRRTEI